MAQTVSLKLDNVLRSPAAEAPKNSSNPDNQAFNAEFDRQIKRDNSPAEPIASPKKPKAEADTTVNPDANKVLKTETTNDADGKNLPLDSKTQPISEKAAPPQQTTIIEVTEVLALPLVEAPLNNNPEVSDEAAIEKWLVALQAEMEHAGVSFTTAEVELLKQTVTPTLLNASPSLILQSDKAVQSNTLAKSMPLTIRADILQAITKNVVQTVSEGQKTLKNVMHAMTQNVDAKISPTAIADTVRQMQAGSGGQDRPVILPLFSGLTPVTSATMSPSPAIALDVQPGLNQPNWSRVVSSRVIYMAREGVQHAELRLNPAQLGPVEVRLSIVNEQTNVTFLANNVATREALEQALPRLRESFAESGLALNNAEVEQQDQSQNPQQDELFTAQKSKIIQVSTELDDISDETPALQSDQQELGSGVSLYA